jgi:PRTRC genetic system protein E
VFVELVPIVKDRNITLTLLCLSDGRFHVMVFPERKTSGENPALIAPFEIKGTAEELDSELHVYLTAYVDAHTRLRTNLAEATATMDEAAKLAREEAKRARERGKKTEQKLPGNSPTRAETPEQPTSTGLAGTQPSTTPTLFDSQSHQG